MKDIKNDHLLCWIFCFTLIIASCPLGLNAGLTGYLKIDDIEGESKQPDHLDEIDIHAIYWNVSQSPDSGSGRTQPLPVVGPLKTTKFVDASSVYLALSSMQSKAIPEIILTLRKASGEAHLDYLKITMTNVKVVSYEVKTVEGNDVPSEEVSFSFEQIKIKYTEQNDDQSAGDEHEIEYDIRAGA